MVAIGWSLLIFSDVTFKMAAWWPYWIFWFPDSIFSLALNMNFKLQRHYTYVYGLEPIDFQQHHFQNGRLAAILDFSVSGLCRWHGFLSISQVCFGISISNFICMLVLVICNSLLIFSEVTFKMAAWWPYWIFWFPDSNFSLALNINSKLQWQILIYMGKSLYWFSVTSFSKWLPGGHIRFFSFWMAWFQQRNSNLLWNFSFKFHVHVPCCCRQKPNDCQLCIAIHPLPIATLSYGAGVS